MSSEQAIANDAITMAEAEVARAAIQAMAATMEERPQVWQDPK